ncbi:hypothetical protein D3C85_721950 [compost metagenome]
MDGLGHQFLANPGFPGDQHRQVAACDQIDFFDQALVGLALADHFPVLLAAGLTIDLGPLVFVFNPIGQPFDAFGRIDGRRGEAGEGLQGIQFDGFETLRVQGVQRQQAPWAFIDKQWAAHAIVDFQVLMEAIDQPVVRVRQVAVRVETRRAGAAEQRGKARVFADFEASPQGIRAQAIHRQRHQPFAVQAQQGRSIAREQGAHGFEQASVALAFGQFTRKVRDQWQ